MSITGSETTDAASAVVSGGERLGADGAARSGWTGWLEAIGLLAGAVDDIADNAAGEGIAISREAEGAGCPDGPGVSALNVGAARRREAATGSPLRVAAAEERSGVAGSTCVSCRSGIGSVCFTTGLPTTAAGRLRPSAQMLRPRIITKIAARADARSRNTDWPRQKGLRARGLIGVVNDGVYDVRFDVEPGTRYAVGLGVGVGGGVGVGLGVRIEASLGARLGVIVGVGLAVRVGRKFAVELAVSVGARPSSRCDVRFGSGGGGLGISLGATIGPSAIGASPGPWERKSPGPSERKMSSASDSAGRAVAAITRQRWYTPRTISSRCGRSNGARACANCSSDA